MHIKYRSDIDGLRAIAVLAVVLFHAFPKVIKGGFIGVDIFFVISGYLITSIIYTDLGNNFSFYNFYVRRIKRIFPALILVLTSCLVFGWFVLSSTEYTQLGKHTSAGSFFYMNFTLLKEVGYFDNASITKPLLHLWSLSIEEQFYIFWPLILWFSSKRGFNLFSVCFVIILISFWFNIKITMKYPVTGFYSPLCRVWELMSGSLLAYFSLNNIEIIERYKNLAGYWFGRVIYAKYKSNNDGAFLLNILSILGFVVGLYYIISFKKIAQFPGWSALTPVISALFIIGAGPNSWVNRKILSNKILVWFGLISYPLYLWHWSLLSYVFILEDNAPKAEVIWGAIILSIFLSWLTYKLVETPIRRSKDKKYIAGLLCLLLSAIGFTGCDIYKKKGYPKRLTGVMLQGIDAHVQDENTIVMGKRCSKILNANQNICNANSEKPKFAILGDSHAGIFFDAVNKFTKLEAASFIMQGFMPFINYVCYKHDKNQTINKEALEYAIKSADLDSLEYFVLLSRGPIYFSGKGFGIEESVGELNGWRVGPIIEDNGPKMSSEQAFIEGYVEVINLLISKGKKVIFVIDWPELGIDPKSCVKRPMTITEREVSECIITRDTVNNRQKKYRELIAEIKTRVPSLMIYDPISVFCDNEKCYGKKDHIIYYLDDDHLNMRGAKLLIEDFQKWLE